MDNCKQFILIMYKASYYFFSQCVDTKYIDVIKQDLMILLTEFIISGKLAHKIQKLCRFSTYQDEQSLA